MAKAEVTRIRVEVSGTDITRVKDLLLAAGADNRTAYGGTWEVEDDGPEVQSTKGGYWGRLTLRRVE